MTDSPPKQTKRLGLRILHASGWDVGGAVMQNAMRLASNLITTRLLMPEAFGLIAMASVILTAIQLTTDIGINRSVVREPDGEDPHFLRVAWVVKIMRSAMIAGAVLGVAVLVWGLAPVFAQPGTIYARPEMPGLIAMIALSPLMAGMSSTKLELAIRHMNRRSVVLINSLAQIIGILTMIGLALISPTVWALMCGMLMNTLVITIATHLFLPGPKMRYEWDAEIAARLWLFGKWIMGSSALTFLGRNLDKFVLGGLLGSTTFGLYIIAQIWVEAGRNLISRLVDTIGFSAIAEITRTRPDELPRLYRRFQNRIDLLCGGAFVLAFFGGPFLINMLYTDQYSASGHYLRLMSFGLLVLRFETLSSMIMNAGNSRAIMITAAIRAVASGVLIPLGYWASGSVTGAIQGMVLTPLVSLPYTLMLVRPILGEKETRTDTLWLLGVVLAVIIGFWILPAPPVQT